MILSDNFTVWYDRVEENDVKENEFNILFEVLFNISTRFYWL